MGNNLRQNTTAWRREQSVNAKIKVFSFNAMRYALCPMP